MKINTWLTARIIRTKRDNCIKHKNTDLLLKMGCKLIVVAVTATNAIRIEKNYDVPFIGIRML
jgi:hypothetical protein